MAETETIPMAKWEGEIMGIRVAVLEDGRRIVNAEDLGALFERIADDDIDALAFSKAIAKAGESPSESHSPEVKP